MKKFFLFLLIVIFNLSILNAKESIEIKAFCSDSKNSLSKFTIQISSNTLHLTEDAIQDNLGGYVDIPEDRYYLKTENGVYRLDGTVENDYKNNIKTFTSYIDKHSKKFISIEELYHLKNTQNLKLIQKINLEKNKQVNSSGNNTTTNILNIYFNKILFDREYQKCKDK